MIEIKPPHKYDLKGKKSVFLTGSIEMGTAGDWQEKLVRSIANLGDDVVVLNPRRDDWDASWKQEIENEKFREQVEWELNGQEKADLIVVYLDPNTKSVITMLEIGLFARAGKMVICCPTGFWRKGNVDVVCAKYKIPQVNTLDELGEVIIERFTGDTSLLKRTVNIGNKLFLEHLQEE
jgi:nucleoside 2-deoxyribosyltransferase